MTTQEKTKILLVFIQKVETVKKKKGRMFYRLTQEEWAQMKQGFTPKLEAEDRFLVFSEKTAKFLQPGQVCEIEAKNAEGSSVYPNTEKYLGVWPDKEAVLEWESNSRAFSILWEERRRMKNASKMSLLRDALDPIREQYLKLIGRDKRAAFLSLVITYITGT